MAWTETTREQYDRRKLRYASDCTDEEWALIRLTTADRLANCIALCCVVAWRISWLTMLRRRFPTASPAAVFTETERVLLNRATLSNRQNAPRDLAFYIIAVARLGGYLDRARDPPPGTAVIWRGFTRLADLVKGYQAANSAHNQLVGNFKACRARTSGA